MPPESPQPDAETLFKSLAEQLGADAHVSRGRMFGSSGLKVGGKIFAMLVKGKLVVKLPAERVQALVDGGAGERFDPGHGRLMREWVSIGPERQAEWHGLAEDARAFVGGKR
jgi:hypothetical protein